MVCPNSHDDCKISQALNLFALPSAIKAPQIVSSYPQLPRQTSLADLSPTSHVSIDTPMNMWQQISFFIAPKTASKYSVIINIDREKLSVLISSMSMLYS